MSLVGERIDHQVYRFLASMLKTNALDLDNKRVTKWLERIAHVAAIRPSALLASLSQAIQTSYNDWHKRTILLLPKHP